MTGLVLGTGLYIATASGAPSVPAAPVLSAAVGNAQVILSWVDGASALPITSHRIYRSTTAGTEVYLATTTSASPYTDTTVSNGTTYYYVVTAVCSIDAGGANVESDFSNEQSATPLANTPSLDYSQTGNSQYVLTLAA